MTSKYILLVLVLTGCGTTPNYVSTAPGSPLPYGLAFCNEWDAVGRCKNWSSNSDECINPKGINEPNPVIPCASIKHEQ